MRIIGVIMFDINCTGSWKFFAPIEETASICEVQSTEQVATEKIDMYALGYSDEVCTIRPTYNFPTDIVRWDTSVEVPWHNWLCGLPVKGSVWDSCDKL